MRWGVVACLGALLLAGAAEARREAEPANARVVVSDASIAPRLARIRTTGRVTWRNAGRTRHVVIPLNAGFAPFVLRSGQSKTVRFGRAGCFPYSVDGRRTAAVAVGRAPCSATGGGGNAGGERSKIVRYDIRVEFNLHWEEHRGGANELTLAWIGTWNGVRFRVRDSRGELHIDKVGAARAVGAFTGTMRFRDTNPDAGPCSGLITYPRLEMLMASSSDWTRGRGTSLAFQFFLNHIGPGETFDQVTRSEQSRCGPGHFPTTPFWIAPDPVVMGVSVDPPASGIHPADARFERERPGPIAFPLDRLRAGRSFTIDTGDQVVPLQPCSPGSTDCQHASTGRVRFIFTARR